MSPHARPYVGDNTIYHIVTRGNNRMQIFHENKDYQFFLGCIYRYQQKYPFLLFHYCLMSNHVHFLLKTIEGTHLKKFMQGINQVYSAYYNKTYSHVGHIWQGRFKSFLVESESYLLECGRYIERNPVRAGMVKDPQEWPVSSYRFYAHGEENDLLTPHDLYLDLGDSPITRQGNYRSYVLQPRAYEVLVDKQLSIA